MALINITFEENIKYKIVNDHSKVGSTIAQITKAISEAPFK